jgi:cell division protein FtsL
MVILAAERLWMVLFIALLLSMLMVVSEWEAYQVWEQGHRRKIQAGE